MVRVSGVGCQALQSPTTSRLRVSTVYFGGGTPSCVGARNITDVLSLLRQEYRVCRGAEVTVECNPHSLTRGFVDRLLAAGVNRFSLGVQSLNDGELARLGRLHRAAQAKDAFRTLRAAGCQNISVDLIYGIPGQTEASWLDTLSRVTADWQPEHISMYALSIEPGTPFARWKTRGSKAWNWPDGDTVMNWYWLAADVLEANGYHRYEISNYARNGFASAHNQAYWDVSKSYLGFGAAAHSFCILPPGRQKRRFKNIMAVKTYIERIVSGERHRVFCRALRGREKTGEEIYLGLRLAKGVTLRKEHQDEFGAVITRHLSDGLIERRAPDRIALTRRGIEIANTVMADYV